MKKLFALLVASVFASSAFAIGLGNDNPGGTGIATATQGQNQGQAQGQIQGQGQAQFTNVAVSNRISNESRAAATSFAAGGNAFAGGGDARAVSGGSQSGVNFNVDYPAQVAAVGLGGLYPSAPCMGTSNIGGGNPFFNVAVGTSWESKECQIRETARSFSAVGLTNDAIAILCSSEYAAVAPSCAKAKAE